MFKELGLTTIKGVWNLSPEKSGGKHLSFITHFNCPAGLISGNTLLKGLRGERLEKGRRSVSLRP